METFVDADGIKAFNGKKILVFGLGILGGGVSMTNWMINHGCRVTVTDLKSKTDLRPSLEQLVQPVGLKLGGHDEDDIRSCDLVVFNPDIPVNSRYVQLAKQLGRGVENEATLFYRLCRLPIIAVTGTRGKTTTCAWIEHFLKKGFTPFPAGNSPDNPFMQALQDIEDATDSDGAQYRQMPGIVVNELPSYHLEYFDGVNQSPEIAVITNIHQDHLNRHTSLEEYVDTKAKVFKHQTESQLLILNHGNEWTDYILRKTVIQRVMFFSSSFLPTERSGLYFDDGKAFFRPGLGAEADVVLELERFVDSYGRHNLENLLAGSMAANQKGISWPHIQTAVDTLPRVPFRQEVIFQDGHMKIVNDNAATSPDGCMAAVERFGGQDCILITGGTDRQLDYRAWAAAVRRRIPAENLIFMEGSATDKMLLSLAGYIHSPLVKTTLESCFTSARKRARGLSRVTIVFSPGAKSFEKYSNEFERGMDFNKIVEGEMKTNKR